MALRIGSLELDSRLLFAPIAGGSTPAYRRIARRYGAGLVVSELVSARGIVRQGIGRNYRYLAMAPDEHPVALQLFGSEPADFAGAIRILLDDPGMAQFDAIDLNLGCPVPKVVRSGAGAALLLDPPRAEAIARAAAGALAGTGKPLTAKLRIGFEAGGEQGLEVARRLADGGVQALTVHGRTREQYYSGTADRAAIGRIVSALAKSHPHVVMIANGDVDSAASAADMYRQTGAPALMIGRAALGRPWIFRDFTETVALDERIAVMREHAEGTVRLLGEEQGCRELRAELQPYLRGFTGASRLRRQTTTLTTLSDVEALLAALAATEQPDQQPETVPRR
ncbi:MAG: tRNA-dihydrouridine synthase family protein [Bacillota bacterium]|nr:tRNA-dihydrouridine synthase family protein [Bacillota bacterium]